MIRSPSVDSQDQDFAQYCNQVIPYHDQVNARSSFLDKDGNDSDILSNLDDPATLNEVMWKKLQKKKQAKK